MTLWNQSILTEWQEYLALEQTSLDETKEYELSHPNIKDLI